MKFRSEYRFTESFPAVRHPDKIYLSGSCFSEHIARRLAYSGFPVKSNSHGILYNPVSLFRSLEEVLAQKRYTKEDLLEHRGKWLSLQHHGSFANHDPETVLAEINGPMAAHFEFLQQTRHLFLTLGTAWAFTWNASGKVVANCHKIQSDKFQKALLSAHEIKQKFSDFLALLKKINPDCSICLTVSPVKHLREGLHNNNLGKAVLLLAVHEIQQEFPGILYFPSYELITDDLRDYRFYEKDLAHPNELAVDYTWEKFSEAFFSEETREVVRQVTDYRLLENHRPLTMHDAPAHLQKVSDARSRLLEKYPYLAL